MRKRENQFLTPELTPLIDVVFLLLIFFLVSSVFKKQENTLELQLPTAQTGQTKKSKTELVTLEISGSSIQLNGEALQKSEIQSKVKLIDNVERVYLRADKGTDYGLVIEVFDLLKQIDIKNISLETIKK